MGLEPSIAIRGLKGGDEMKYYECPYCGAHLDHGEPCDCKQAEAKSTDENNREEKKSA